MRVHAAAADDDDADDDDGDVVLIMKVRFPAFWQQPQYAVQPSSGVFTCMRSVRACMDCMRDDGQTSRLQ